MRKRLTKIGLVGPAVALTILSGPVAFALPAQANVHAQAANNTPASSNSTTRGSSAAISHEPTPATNAQTGAQTHLAGGQLTACKNREAAITNIMTRIDTRAQNQITLFGTIASRVEAFYTRQGKTLSNYDQLVAAVNTAETQANTDFGTLRATSNFSCTSNDPRGMVTEFQSYLKTEITDLQNYRTAVKNLIVGVASANGVTVSSSATGGGQ